MGANSDRTRWPLIVATAGLALSGRACLIDPQKDFPVGQAQEVGGNRDEHDPTQPIGGREGVATGGGEQGGLGGANDSGRGGISNSGGATSALCDTDAACAVGEYCQDQRCQCAACPQGTLAGLPNDSCVTRVDAVASGSSASDEVPELAIDGDSTTSWASGDYSGTLTISFPTPQPVAAIVLVPRASAGVVDYTISIRNDEGSTEVLTARFVSPGLETWTTARLKAAAMVTEITIAGHSTDSWISLWEVLTLPCE